MSSVPLVGTSGQLAAWRAQHCTITEVGEGDAQPCQSCGEPARTLIDGVPLHATCPSPQTVRRPGIRPPAGAARPPAAAGGSATRAAAGSAGPAELLAGVLAADGLWLPGAAAAVKVAWPRHAGEAFDLAEAHRLRQLWIHPSAHQVLPLPRQKAEGNPQKPEAHPWMDAAGYTCDPPGLAAWVNVKKDGGMRRRAIVLAGYESRASWHAAPTGPVLLEAVTQLAAVLPKGCSYYYSPNVTSASIIRKHQSGLPLTQWPLPEGTRVRHVGQWSRLLSHEEEGARWVHRYDTNGQQLAVWNVKLGLGNAVRVAGATWKPAAKKLAGYWLTEITGDWRPDPRLPDLLIPWYNTGETRVWLPGPYVELLAEAGATFGTPEAWLWPESSAWLETSGKALKSARAQLEARKRSDDDPSAVALKVVKAMYTSRIGAFSPHDPAKVDELVRPDVRDMIISKAFANDYRRMIRVGQGRGGTAGSGRWPIAIAADAAYYVSDEPDGEKAAPAGMVLGSGLGEYSLEATVPLAAVQDELGGRRFVAAVEACLRQRKGQRDA